MSSSPVTTLSSPDPLVVVHHWDTDGVASALILREERGKEPLFFPPSPGRYNLTASQREELSSLSPRQILLADMNLSQEEYLRLTRPFLASRNIRLREALLESLDRAVRDGRFLDKEPLSLFLKDMLITTSEFKPEFRVRERYLRVVQHLEERATHG